MEWAHGELVISNKKIWQKCEWIKIDGDIGDNCTLYPLLSEFYTHFPFHSKPENTSLYLAYIGGGCYSIYIACSHFKHTHEYEFEEIRRYMKYGMTFLKEFFREITREEGITVSSRLILLDDIKEECIIVFEVIMDSSLYPFCLPLFKDAHSLKERMETIL